VDFVSIWGSTLHHIDDLPYEPTTYFPHVYGNFRKKNVDVKVRPLFDAPEKGKLFSMPAENRSEIEKRAASFLPDLEKDLKFTKEEIDFVKDKEKRACYNFVGGEDAGLKRCKEYIFSRRSVAHYNNTRNDLLGANYSSKLSPWLANGCLSPRMVYHEVKRFENE
jgi:deoxyribodipyrimidine photo-lyase